MSYPPPFMAQSMMPPLNQPPPNFRPPGTATIGSLPQMYSNPQPLMQVNTDPPRPEGPLITVFVGNISERIPDTMMKKLLGTCGTVVNWKRVSTFGFSEYDGPIAGARAVRLLNDLEIDGRRLVAKVDAKNKALLDEYESETNLNASQATKDANAAEEKKDDKSAVDIIQEIIDEYADEIKNAPKNPNNIDTMHKPHKTLSNSNVPDEKRDIINQEIGKFRKYTEEAEQKREREKDRKAKEVERQKADESPGKQNSRKSRRRTPEEVEEKSPKKEKKSRRRSSSRERDIERERQVEREKEERMRERERQMERERRMEREDLPKIVKNMKDLQREKEIEEEARERKKQEKKVREKEAAYQERLRNWEVREKRKAKEYGKEREKENIRLEEREKEAKRLKEFLEDYEDDRDDARFYKGRELQRRLADRVREADFDAKDRAREQEELEELKNKIFSGDYDNPSQEFEKQKREREELYKPKLYLAVTAEKPQQRTRKPLPTIENEVPIEVEPIDSDDDDRMSEANHHDRMSVRDSESRDGGGTVQNEDFHGHTPNSPARSTPVPTFQVTLNLGANVKKKKLEVKDVFANDDDQEEVNGPKKRKLVPLDYDDLQPSKSSPSENKSISSRGLKKESSQNSVSRVSDEAQKQQRPDDEKRRHIKGIIDKIPTEKNALFNYPLDKSEIDSAIEKKIRPWINKKIIEYIGEPEPTLVDFICSKVLAGSTPQGILDDVQMVLDEEAEVFVVKMWRLLIYEVEAKKVGITK